MLKRIIDTLGWAGVALVFAAVVVRFRRPDLVDWWRGLALGGLVVVALYLATQWREIAQTFSRRQARYGALTAASVVLVIALLAGLNYVATRNNRRWDLTTNQQFSLSDQTRRILGALKEPLKIEVYARTSDFVTFRDRLGEYTYASPRVSVEYVDVDREPSRARENEVQAYNTVLVRYGSRTERTNGANEQELTNAIIKAVEGRTKKVYFVTGHKERDTTSSDERTGYSALSQALTRDNFAVAPLLLAQQRDVPADADVLVIAGPEGDLLDDEVTVLTRYLERGGKLFALVDPPAREGAPGPARLLALLKQWGFTTGGDYVLDVSVNVAGQVVIREVAVAGNYPAHPITDPLRGALSIFPQAQSISPATDGPRVPTLVLQSSENSFALKDRAAFNSGGEIKIDEGKGDKKGPVTIGAALALDAANAPAPAPPAEGQEPAPPVQTRLAVFGDSDFAANGFLGVEGNSDLFLNTVNWLAGQDSLISVRPREADDRRITMTPDRTRFTVLFSVLFLPMLFIGAGIVTWWRRR
jgi:ABC-type uncharacterized transport system involved in gliding motility auxiliary subunit